MVAPVLATSGTSPTGIGSDDVSIFYLAVFRKLTNNDKAKKTYETFFNDYFKENHFNVVHRDS